MRRAWMIAGAMAALAFVAPVSAIAQDTLPPSVFYPHIGVSIIGLVVAVILLVEALAVRRIGQGGAIAEKISYVILAILCLAASAITEWVVIFTDEAISIAQAQLAREVLVIVAMGLLAAYFNSVHKAMSSYLRVMNADVTPEADAAPVADDAAAVEAATEAPDSEASRG